MSQDNDSTKYQLIGLFVVLYLIFCLFILGAFWGPLMFIIWICSGWKMSRLLTDSYLLGSEEVKTVATVGIFSLVLGILLLI
jgi:hypothetical protein